jgi:hypothetical protein
VALQIRAKNPACYEILHRVSNLDSLVRKMDMRFGTWNVRLTDIKEDLRKAGLEMRGLGLYVSG